MTGMLGKIRRFFFQKASNDFDANEAFRRNQARYNALYALDPDVLVRHLAAFQRGDICGLERVLDEFEAREDKMRIGAFKMAAAVSSKPWEVRVRKGEEDNPRAKVHQAALTRFWNRAEATDAFCRNRRGGIRLLLKQMMQAQSRVYSVHDITWKVNGDGTLDATFTHVPAWCFENRTGRLRYIRNDGQTAGEEMPDGEWLVTVGEGVGVAAAILAMAKRLSWNDWLLFSEKCGMPVVIGRTNAQRGTPAWDQLARAIRAVAPKTGLVADTGSDISAVPMGSGGGKETYRDLVDTVDRAISALYRGGDLATTSGDPDAAGVNAQAGESELMDADGCAMVSETLRDQVEKFVIRFECGDFEPLAEIVVNPPAETEDVDREMAIDNHLAALGVKLSKSEALARYGRTEAESDDDALKAPQPANPGGFGGFGLPNEAPAPRNPSSVVAKALQNARRGAGATSVPPEAETRSDAILRDFAADMGPAAEKIKSLLDALDAGQDVRDEARRLAGELPDLMADDPAMAAVIEEAMAEAFAGAAGGKDEGRTTKDEGGAALANSTDANGAEHGEAGSGKGGQFVEKGDGGGSSGEAAKPEAKVESDKDKAKREREELLSGELKRISVNQAKSVLSEPVTVENPTGATFRFTNEKLLGDSSHLKADHTDADFARRARVMLYGIDAAKTSRDIENKQASQPNELGVYAQRKEVRKSYTDKVTGKRFEVVVRADRDGEVFDVFDIFPK